MKITLPDQWQFKTEIKIRVSDLNYGNHLGNEKFLTYAQEARVEMFAKYGFTELDFGGVSLIQADAALTYKGEGHLGDKVQIEVSAVRSGGSSFNVFYRFFNLTKDRLMAEVRTAIICFDYEKGRPVALPEAALTSGIFLE
ncbi:MAG: acyl-CoA thioesterase [Bacteroidia bacterium]